MAEEISRVQIIVLYILKQAAMNRICPRLGDSGDVGYTAKFCRVDGLANANLSNGIEGRKQLRDSSSSALTIEVARAHGADTVNAHG